MTKPFHSLATAVALVVAVGCGGGNRSGDAAGSGDPKADLAAIWAACKESYRKTKAMPPPNEIPGGLAAKYKYESTAGISLNKHSTNVIAYEGKSQGGKRYALFSDGRIEQVSDSELRRVGVEPDAAKQRNQEAENQRKIDEFNKKLDEESKKPLP
jgi:hypothetical protein